MSLSRTFQTAATQRSAAQDLTHLPAPWGASATDSRSDTLLADTPGSARGVVLPLTLSGKAVLVLSLRRTGNQLVISDNVDRPTRKQR